MTGGGVRDARSFERRRWRRVRLAVPVQFGRDHGGQEGALCPHAGWSSNVSPGGLHFSASEGGPFAPGERLTVSIDIPWEARSLFPFSRIVGPCQIVRVEEGVTGGDVRQTGLALSFLRDQITLLGAVVTP